MPPKKGARSRHGSAEEENEVSEDKDEEDQDNKEDIKEDQPEEKASENKVLFPRKFEILEPV